MNPYLMIFLVTALTGTGGLALGGGLAAAVRDPSDRTMSLLLRFTAGVMFAVVCFDLIADATENLALVYALLWIFLGYVCTYLLNCWIDKRAHHSHSHSHEQHNPNDPAKEMCACGHHTLHTAGLVLAAAVALHNMPVGMAIGATFAGEAGVRGGILAALIIGLHNLPEGMSVAAPLLSGGAKPWTAIGIAALSGVPTVLGALLGYSVGAMNPVLLGLSLSFAAGAMLYVIFGELIPESEELWRNKLGGFASLLGLLLGLALIFSGHVH